MRIRILTLAIAVLSIAMGGCATGVRLGGERYGAGVGGYVGQTPKGHSTYDLP